MNARREPDVTVLIAAYNCADFVDRAIGSALSQGGVELEVLVIDDASVDETRSALHRIADRDERVQVIGLARNGGPAAARNAGLDAAKGEWVAILDADDAFEQGRLERLVQLGRHLEADMIADNFRYFNARTMTPGSAALKETGEPEILDRYAFVQGARPYAAEADLGMLQPLFRRTFLEEHALRYPVDVRHGEDFLLYLEILLQGGRFVLSREPGYLYTTRDSGLSRTMIDYEGQIRDVESLSRRPDVASDKALLALLHARANALRRLAAERELQRIVATKKGTAVLRFAFRGRWNAALAARWVTKAVVRKVRFAARLRPSRGPAEERIDG